MIYFKRLSMIVALFLMGSVALVSCRNAEKEVTDNPADYRVVDIEHHFATKSELDGFCLATYGMPYDSMPQYFRNGQDPALVLGEERLKVMDAAGVDYVHLSAHIPGRQE